MLLAALLDPLILDGIVDPSIPLLQSMALLKSRLQALTANHDNVPFRLGAPVRSREERS
jgi:hypothetical protein